MNELSIQVRRMEEKQLAADYMLGEIVSYMAHNPDTVGKDHFNWTMRNFEKYNKL